ncbi:TPA: hypothetical protein ACUB6L_004586 [Raoultella ornithinolytica]
MTNNQLTRERIELIANFHRAMTLPPSHDEIEELARMALAAIDCEPVAYTDEAELCFVNDMACMWTKGMGINEVPLYRHAQQPVVPDEMSFEAAISFIEEVGALNERDAAYHAWNACRAAMLNGGKS